MPLMYGVLATIVSFYEFQFAPLLPLWMPALHFSLTTSAGFCCSRYYSRAVRR
jgi:hypothetical protein